MSANPRTWGRKVAMRKNEAKRIAVIAGSHLARAMPADCRSLPVLYIIKTERGAGIREWGYLEPGSIPHLPGRLPHFLPLLRRPRWRWRQIRRPLASRDPPRETAQAVQLPPFPISHFYSSPLTLPSYFLATNSFIYY